jgi:WD40 repeat protein
MQFLDLAGGQIQEVPLVQDWGATDTAFSPEGQLLATSSGEGTVHLWDTGSLEVVDVLRGHLLGVHGVTFSPDGQRLASSSHGDEAIKLWDVSTRHEVATLTGEGLITDRLQFSPDGRMLLAVNAKGKAQIWRAPPLTEIAAMEAASGGRSATATSEGL